MSAVILGIHGLANKPKRDLKAQWWKEAITEGLAVNCGVRAQFEFEMVYWADLLYSQPNHDDADFAFDDLYNAEPYRVAPDKALKRRKEGLLDAVRAKAGQIFGRIADAAQDDLALGQLESRLLGRLVRDLDFYYDDARQIRGRDKTKRLARTVLRDELRSALLRHRGKHILLVSHSMGTIISYDVLRDLGREDRKFTVDQFVTLGSPLGLSLVKARVASERALTFDRKPDKDPVRTPTIVRESWVNFADGRDPVAADSHLSDDYARNDSDVEVQDDLVWNDYVPPGSDRPNPHKSYGYLRTPEFSDHLRKFLGV
jgi:hypothetical protein